VEASRKLAERVVTEGPPTPWGRIGYAFRLATGREPKPAETKVLMNVWNQQLETFRKNSDAATKFLSVGESKRNEKLDPVELAAYSAVASVILNLDETITKG